MSTGLTRTSGRRFPEPPQNNWTFHNETYVTLFLKGSGVQICRLIKDMRLKILGAHKNRNCSFHNETQILWFLWALDLKSLCPLRTSCLRVLAPENVWFAPLKMECTVFVLLGYSALRYGPIKDGWLRFHRALKNKNQTFQNNIYKLHN